MILQSHFSNEVENQRPITTGENGAVNQSEFLAISCNSLKAREKSCVHGAIGFGFDSHWLKNWRESFKPITKRSNRNHVITFDTHLKTALVRVAMRIAIVQLLYFRQSFENSSITAMISIHFLNFSHSQWRHHSLKLWFCAISRPLQRTHFNSCCDLERPSFL